MNLEIGQVRRLPAHMPLCPMRPAAEQPSLEVRLAQTILAMAECTEIDVAHSIFVTRAISIGHLAALTGSKPKSVASVIERFILLGLVEKRRERFIIRRPEKLRDIIIPPV